MSDLETMLREWRAAYALDGGSNMKKAIEALEPVVKVKQALAKG